MTIVDIILDNPGAGSHLSREHLLRAGVGVPVGGSERTNAVLDLALVHGI